MIDRAEYRRNTIGQWSPVNAEPRHHQLIVSDISGFSRRDEATKIVLRQVLYRITQEAYETAGIPWSNVHHEDRGDGILMVPHPPGLKNILKTLDRICAGVTLHNRTVHDEEHVLRLRMALADGYVHRDQHGFTGSAVNFPFRLLEAETFKRQLNERAAQFGLIISDALYRTATGFHLIEAKSFSCTCVDVKETRTHAWTWIPSDVRGDPQPGRLLTTLKVGGGTAGDASRFRPGALAATGCARCGFDGCGGGSPHWGGVG